ncbi:MAG: gliding motility lipoprotein GldH [Bacteroidales bacterium]|jgi:gliding motility-associated lipoprotein GldH|nr:gliding motility lipoprotein GldH [Bacteroidales bacterium]
MKTHTLIALLIGLLVFAACDSKVFYDETCRVDEQGWNMDDKLVYNIDVDDTAQTYLCCLDVRVRNDYPYSNIYFFLSTVYPNGDVAVDTNIEFQLAAPDGKWMGREQGRYVDGRYPFCYFRFPERGSYQFVLRHAMRDTLLRGVKDVGLHIEHK